MMSLMIQGCAVSKRIVYVKPECSAPEQPVLRKINAAELWDAIDKKVFDDLVYNQRKVVDWAVSMESMINDVLCKKAGE